MADLINLITVVSLLVITVFAVGSYAAAVVIYRRKKLCTPIEKWVLTWLVFDAVIHFTLEGPFVVLSCLGTVEKSDHFTALLWQEYGKADKRWLHSDPTIVSLEMLTVFLAGPLCILLVYAIMENKHYRHFVQLVLCTCELYGGWMTFCPDWFIGSPNLVTDNPLYLWLYLIFFNGIWVVIPLALMWQSWVHLRDLTSSSRPKSLKLKGDNSSTYQSRVTAVTSSSRVQTRNVITDAPTTCGYKLRNRNN